MTITDIIVTVGQSTCVDTISREISSREYIRLWTLGSYSQRVTPSRTIIDKVRKTLESFDDEQDELDLVWDDFLTLDVISDMTNVERDNYVDGYQRIKRTKIGNVVLWNLGSRDEMTLPSAEEISVFHDKILAGVY